VQCWRLQLGEYSAFTHATMGFVGDMDVVTGEWRRWHLCKTEAGSDRAGCVWAAAVVVFLARGHLALVYHSARVLGTESSADS
jgi:hypothetical protein